VDECVPELAQSNLNLISLILDGTSLLEDDSIRLILDSFPKLQYLSFSETGLSSEIEFLSLQRVAIPSLKSSDPAVQLMGLQGLQRLSNIEVLSVIFNCYDPNTETPRR
jgi:hypothetical protein